MVELRNAINIYSELNSQIDIIILVATEDVERATSILESVYDNWFDLEQNPELQSIPIGDYLSDELTKAGIYHEIYYRVEPEEETRTEWKA